MRPHSEGWHLSILERFFVLRIFFYLTLIGGGLIAMSVRGDFLISSPSFSAGEAISTAYA
jgi:hypothetical protein